MMELSDQELQILLDAVNSKINSEEINAVLKMNGSDRSKVLQGELEINPAKLEPIKELRNRLQEQLEGGKDEQSRKKKAKQNKICTKSCNL